VERPLDEEMLVIADAARAVAIAGVMGGEESEVSAATRDVLIESAYFNPASVRRTARALGLHTEASYRFERGVDYEGVLRAQERAIALICEIAGGTATEDAVDVYPKIIRPPTANLRFARIKKLTGLEVPDEEAKRILRALGFSAGEESVAGADASGHPSSHALVSPTWRVDIEREEDLVEEVARHFGYEKIAEELPASNVAGAYRPGDDRRRATRRTLAAAGFDEAISFSFIAATHDEQFDLLPGLQTAGASQLVTLDNPVIEGVTRMRPTLLPGVLDAVRYNFNHGTRHVRLFEIGRVFAAGSSSRELPHERETLALVMTGGAIEENRAGASRDLDFFDLKGALETVADAVKVAAPEFVVAGVKHLSEGQTARVLVGGHAVGFAGRLAEDASAEYKFRQPVYVAEIDFGTLLRTGESPVRYMPLERFPSVTRDVTVTVNRRTTFAELRGAVIDLGLTHCRSVSLVGTFEPNESARAVTIRTEYRADDRTLHDDEVNEMQKRVNDELSRFATGGEKAEK
jgi:phenylalanyl-tRNA synthetase beta chain